MAAWEPHGGIARILERWTQDGLIVQDHGSVLALAVNAAATSERRATTLRAPVAYLDSGPANPRRLPVVS
jgi:hypothetical protein